MTSSSRYLGRTGLASLCCLAVLLPAGPVPADTGDTVHFLRFKEQQRVELDKTRGMIDLEGSFTIEAWVRVSAENLKMMYLMGDEIWPGVSDAVPVKKTSGWVLRTTDVEGADRRAFDFSIAVAAGGKSDWLRVITKPRRINDHEWQHLAVCKTPETINVFWDGSLAASRRVRGLKFTGCPTNLFLGPRQQAGADRQFYGDFRAVRISSKARYTTTFAPPDRFVKDDDTFLLLEFKPGSDKQILDLSGNDRHGLIDGPEWHSEPAKPKKDGTVPKGDR